MRIKFTKLILHHFLSFGEAEINLDNQGYVLVKGINNCTNDNALSNGSGKSTIWSAISWALLGETLQGIKTNVPNAYYNDGCYVSLTFYIDNDKYEITRYKEDKKYGTNLIVLLNDENISGKGIKESSKILNDRLPDLTSNLIGSVIILGQGLPQKFSNNTPSGRKEVLEQLSKTSFMIEEIKDKVASRQAILSNKKNEIVNELNNLNRDKQRLKSEIDTSQSIINEYTQKDFSKIDTLKTSIDKINNEINSLEDITTLNTTKDKLNSTLMDMINDKNEVLNGIKSEYDKSISSYTKESYEISSEIKTLKQEIERVKNMKDYCPTCKQKLINFIRPNTSEAEDKLKKLEENLAKINNDLTNLKECCNKEQNDTETAYNNSITNYRASLNELTTKINTLTSKYTSYNNQLTSLNKELNELSYQQGVCMTTIDTNKAVIEKNTNLLQNIDSNIVKYNREQDEIIKHLDIINNIKTLAARDLRGYLLSDIVEFINVKAKEYCSYVFNNTSLSLFIEGNNLNIAYGKIPYENLSGGEKQKVDLIIQFALRDMLSTYLSFSSNILVLDEIFDNLDSVGTNKILDLIANKLLDIDSIYIITHHTFDLAIPNDRELVVVKDENGVSSIQ